MQLLAMRPTQVHLLLSTTQVTQTNAPPRGKELSFTLTGTLRKSIPVTAFSLDTAFLGDLEVPVSQLNPMSFCKTIVFTGNNACPIAQGPVTIKKTFTVPAIEPSVSLAFVSGRVAIADT
jgi:hypothetical protein